MECPACSGKDLVPQKWRRGKCMLVRCRACGLEFWDPIHNPGAAWYGAGLTEFAYLRPVWSPHIGVKKFFRDMPATGGRLIDVGCGVGDFCYMASQAGYQVTGIDYTPEYIEAGRRRFPGIDLQALSVDDFLAQRPQDKYDALTLVQVLEHVEDPWGFVESVKRLLKPGGYIMCNVPNRRRWRSFSPPMREEWDLPPHHLTWWDPKTLSGLFERCGFSVVALEEDHLTALDCAYLLADSHAIHKAMEWVGRRLMGGAVKAATSAPAVEQASGNTRRLVRLGYGIYTRAWPFACGVITSPLVPLTRRTGISIYLLARLKG